MSSTIFPITGTWSGERPKLAWIFEIGDAQGSGFNVRYGAAQKYSGSIDMAALLANPPTGKPTYNDAANKNPMPSALSLSVGENIYLGFRLAKKLDAGFSATPFSAGNAAAASVYADVTRVSDVAAYMLVRGSAFPRPDAWFPFNIHLEAEGKIGQVSYVTPIILDPDTRYPDGAGPPP